MSLADLYSALADSTRLRVLELLHDKARPVHELAAAFDISRPAISRHLRVLKEAGLVQEVKQGRENLYSFQRAELKPGIAWLNEHQKKPGRVKKSAVEAVVVAEAPVAVEIEPMLAEPIVVPEQVVVPEPVVEAPVPAPEPVLVAAQPAPEPLVAPEPAADPIIIAKPKAAPRPRVARPKAEVEPVAPPPPKQTPQLSFFDL